MAEYFLDAVGPQATGGMIVSFKTDVDASRRMKTLEDAAGGGARTVVAAEAAADGLAADGAALMLDEIGVALLAERDDVDAVANTLRADDAVQEVRPEFWMHASQPYQDTAERTWGVAASGAADSAYDGAGVRLCVLDTGLDLGHPDYVGRAVVARSFVAGETVDDVQGHGTHCAGTAAGRGAAPGLPRYGVAPAVDLHVCKVLDNSGNGRERDILLGMLWAIDSGCEVISMSLGRPTRRGETSAPEYERLGRLALDRGLLIIAASGNDSARRYGFVAPVGAPANASTIMAVGAVDQQLGVAEFSNGGINPGGGQLDIAGPGVGVASSVPRPRLYATLRGTSMACPHVAGVAALWAQADPSLRGAALWSKLTQTAMTLQEPARDVGAGLARAPSMSVAGGTGATPS